MSHFIVLFLVCVTDGLLAPHVIKILLLLINYSVHNWLMTRTALVSF